MATTVRYKHGLEFCADLESGRVTCDAFSDRGKEYPSAPELLMVSLGSCIGAVVLTYSDRHGINYEGMEIDLDWELAHEHPHRIGRIDVKVRMPGPLTPEQIEILKRVADQCLIHNTLLHPPEIRVDLEPGKG
jgi:putative redox protein